MFAIILLDEQDDQPQTSASSALDAQKQRPDVLTGRQIREARRLLRWSYLHTTAAAGISVDKLIAAQRHTGSEAADPKILLLLRRAFQAAGVVFGMDGDLSVARPDGPKARLSRAKLWDDERTFSDPTMHLALAVLALATPGVATGPTSLHASRLGCQNPQDIIEFVRVMGRTGGNDKQIIFVITRLYSKIDSGTCHEFEKDMHMRVDHSISIQNFTFDCMRIELRRSCFFVLTHIKH